MKAKCNSCQRFCDHPMKEWSWVRYKGSFKDSLVCPACRLEAEALEGSIVSVAAA